MIRFLLSFLPLIIHEVAEVLKAKYVASKQKKQDDKES